MNKNTGCVIYGFRHNSYSKVCTHANYKSGLKQNARMVNFIDIYKEFPKYSEFLIKVLPLIRSKGDDAIKGIYFNNA